jgi:flagellar basal body-associated protein FliL
MAESTDAKVASPEAPAPVSKGSKLLIILALVNFLAVLGMGGYLFYTRQQVSAQPTGKDDKEAGAPADAEEEGHGEAAEGEHGEVQAGEHEAPNDAHGAKKDGKAPGGRSDDDEMAASPHGDERAGSGPLLPLDAMVTNLGEPDSDRYLKVTMQLRLTSEAARAEVERQLVPVRNQILLFLSSLTVADTSGADNKREIQKKVKRIANESLHTSRITQVYFTEFVIQ